MRNPATAELQHISRLEGNANYRRICHEEALLKMFQDCGAPRTAVIRGGVFVDQSGPIAVTRQATEDEIRNIEELALVRDVAATESNKAQFALRETCEVPLDARWDAKARVWIDPVTGEPLLDEAAVPVVDVPAVPAEN